jgi:hypothetical protein
MKTNDTWWKDGKYEVYERIVRDVSAWVEAEGKKSSDPLWKDWATRLVRYWSWYLKRMERNLKGQGVSVVFIRPPELVTVEGVAQVYYELHDPHASHSRPIREIIHVRGELPSGMNEAELKWAVQGQLIDRLFGEDAGILVEVVWHEFHTQPKGKQK